MIILIIIYIISIIGAILYIRYDSEDELDSVLLLILCPALNSVVTIYELGKFLIYINDRFLSKFNKPLIKLIKYKRKWTN
jgi:hypothetical protein